MRQDDVAGVQLRLHARPGHHHEARRATEELRAQEGRPRDDRSDEAHDREDAPEAPEGVRRAHP